MTPRITFYCAFSAILFLCIFLFLWLGCPQYLLYHEQNQLFLFTWSYFVHAVAVPGGFADYISEFVVQFYYVPLYGALFAALVLTLSQVFLGLACRRCPMPATAYVLASIPSVLYLGGMGDENMLMSFGVAMMLTSLSIYLATLRAKVSVIKDITILTVGFCVLYWFAGPVAFIFISSWCILRRRPAVMPLLIALLAVYAVHWLWFEQYPLSALTLGINYYRIPEVYPTVFFIIVGVMAVVPLITCLKTDGKGWIPYGAAVAVVIFAVIYVPASFNKDKSRILAYDSLARQGRWTDIIERAREEQPSDHFSLQALNLALGMTGQLTETMFSFNQNGVESLVGTGRLDNTSQLITAEALFRLGLTNIAFSTTFDLQEAIMNDRKSGRHMKRLAECMLINGKYDVAAKYIGSLRNSLFYRDWALQAEQLLNNDSAVEAHPIYGPLRRNAFTKEGFYYHSLLEKILAMLVLDGNGNNRLAWDYFCATAMLKGDLATLAGVCNFYTDRFGQQALPRHVQEALAMYWTFSHPSFEGMPFPISNEVKRETEILAKTLMRNKNNPVAWRNAAPGSYGVYFLDHSNSAKPVSAPEYQPTHE
ncbi:MAG: hypothetical protein K2J58_00630 [Muribaculaceae bacterium]|nr:hypothetical protein [Muribaculaceae bacterium]